MGLDWAFSLLIREVSGLQTKADRAPYPLLGLSLPVRAEVGDNGQSECPAAHIEDKARGEWGSQELMQGKLGAPCVQPELLGQEDRAESRR